LHTLNSFIDNLVDVFNIAACRLMIAMFDVSLIHVIMYINNIFTNL